MSRAIIWDFDETLARRSGRWSDTLVEVMNLEAPGHSWAASSFVPGLTSGFPWHEWERPHPELSDPDRWWESLRPVLRGALDQAGVSHSVAESASKRFRAEYLRLDRWSVFADTRPALERLRRGGWRRRPDVGRDRVREAPPRGVRLRHARARKPGIGVDGRRQRRGRHRRRSSCRHPRDSRSSAGARVRLRARSGRRGRHDRTGAEHRLIALSLLRAPADGPRRSRRSRARRRSASSGSRRR